MSENTAVLGDATELSYNGGTITDVVLNFRINESYINNDEEYEGRDDELQGIKRFNIFKYFEDENILLPIATKHNVENNTVYVEVDELGTYCLIDMEKLMSAWGILEDKDGFFPTNCVPKAVKDY